MARTLLRIIITVLGGAVAAVIGAALFVGLPADMTELVGILLTVLVAIAGVRMAYSVSDSLFPSYNVAEVAVNGPISRDSNSRPLPSSPMDPGADEIVEQIERADAEEHVDALLVKLNTPGGEVVPSDDIRRAIEDFDGPSIAYTTDLCASGGYWIASGCDELWARKGSIVGSIGVIGSRYNIADLADRLGVSYERFVAGDFKDAGSPFREMSDEERDYLQQRVDEFYDQFIERVAEGRDLEESFVRDTEAKVYLGEEAHELDLVDHIGTTDDIREQLQTQLDADEIVIEQFEPERGFVFQLQQSTAKVAYAFGAGVANVLSDGTRFRFR